MRMRAAKLVEPRRIEVVDAEVADPEFEEVRVRIAGCGVCSSNVPPFEGREWFNYPMEPGALGHEAWGTVEAVGPGVQNVKEGDPVAFLGQWSYAEYEVTRAAGVIILPKNLHSKPFPGEPIGCAVNILKRSGIREGQTVAIVGVGFLGALLIQLAKAQGARVIAIAHRPFSQEVAALQGADLVVGMDEHWSTIEQVKEATTGAMADVVIEAVGKEWPLNLAAELTKIRGRLVIAGYHQDGLRSVNLQLWNWRGLDVINAHEREEQVYLQGIREAVELVSRGTLDPYPLFTHMLPLHRLQEALQMTIDRPPKFLKALVSMDLE